ncbi:MAG: hypothetical protein HYY01_14635 [Chloroflexi bacterium]|nr:hypothetical protein [Chloroflexota bacterium]
MRESGLFNIGPREKSFRRGLGALVLALTAMFAVYFFAYDIGQWWRAVLFVPVFLGTSLLFEARSGTCPLKAELGQEDLQDRPLSIGGTQIADIERARQIRSVSRRAQLKALGVAVVVTIVATLLPS